MRWLQKLHLISAPENTTLHSAELSLRGLLPWWLALLLLLAGGVGVVFLYLRENSTVGIARRLTLAGLRIVLLGLVLMLLLRPVLLAEFHGERPRSVALLLDNTQSMQQVDRRLTPADRLRAALAHRVFPPPINVEDADLFSKLDPNWQDPSRIDLVRAVLQNEDLKLLESLRPCGPLQPFLFDNGLRSIAPDAFSTALTASGDKTALADALYNLLLRGGEELPTAVVVMSDGRDNASKRSLAEVARLYRDKGVPLHIYSAGSAEAGLLELKDVGMPRTLFVDPKPDVRDDPVKVPVLFRCRGFKRGTLVLTLDLAGQIVRHEVPVREGEDVREELTLEPRKGPEGTRPYKLTIELKGSPETKQEVQGEAQVKSNRVKVLYVESTPRREYKFIQPVLDRDRRVLLRLLLTEGDEDLAKAKPDAESGAMYLDKFPETFPSPPPGDPDRKPYDLLILGDVPLKSLGTKGPGAIQRFVKEGGGLVMIAGQLHAPAEYANKNLKPSLAEVLPVKFEAHTFATAARLSAKPFRPVLTYDGESSALLSLADNKDENLKLWKDELWEHVPGFYWHYPVGELRTGATALLVHPEKKVGDNNRPMPLIATHFYGRGEVLFLAVDEMWRWRDGTGDALTARLWGQIVVQLGLPHLLNNSRRTQLDLMGPAPVLGRPGTRIKARVLSPTDEPVKRSTIDAVVVPRGSKGEDAVPVVLKPVGDHLPGEYRADLHHTGPGPFELRVREGQGVEAATLPYRVELPPNHEMEKAPPAVEALRNAAEISGGRLYYEEGLHEMASHIAPRKAPFVLRQEVLLWGPLSLVVFILLISGEWLLRKFSNMS